MNIKFPPGQHLLAENEHLRMWLVIERKASDPARMSDQGIALLKRFEGLRLRRYQDVAGVWTIGYGHAYGPGEQVPDEITEAEAERLLREDIAWAETIIKDQVRVPLTTNQRDALTSWAFNVGPAAVRRSDLVKRLNRGEYEAVPYELSRWNKASRVNAEGKKEYFEVGGLTRRRRIEGELWQGVELSEF